VASCALGGVLAVAVSGCPTVTTTTTTTTTTTVTTVTSGIPPLIKPQLESLERDSELHPPTFLKDGWERAQAIVLIATASGDRGTGALVGDRLLLTAGHVLPSLDAARGAKAYFGYFADPPPDASVSLSPDEFFQTSGKDEHDWTLVRLAGDPCKGRRSLALRKSEVAEGKHVNIIQHPGGGRMMFASGKVVSAGLDKLQYTTSTLRGSSGAPVFDDQWNLVGIHRQGDVSTNAGVPIGVILDDLVKKAGPQKETCAGGAT
jgi:hypothetical protein